MANTITKSFLLWFILFGSVHAQRNSGITGADRSKSYGFQSAIAAGIGFMDEAQYIHGLFRFLLDAPLPISNGIGFIPQIGIGVGGYVSNGDKFYEFMSEAGGRFNFNSHFFVPVGLMYKTSVPYHKYFLSGGMSGSKYYDPKTLFERLFLFAGFGYSFANSDIEVRLLHNINNSIKEANEDWTRLIPHHGANIGLEFNMGIVL
jgi:hypothetical protein